MTKFNNVVINGNTLEVPAIPAQAAVKYERVGRAGEGNSAKPEVGDVIVYESEPRSYIAAGVAYVVTGFDGSDAIITDDDGDDYDTCGDEFTVYRKIAGDPEQVMHNGQTFRKEARAVGKDDKYVFCDRAVHGWYTAGKVYEVTGIDRDGDPLVTDDDGDDGVLCKGGGSTYVALIPVSEETTPSRRLTVGDYAKVVRSGGGHNYSVGSIVKITVDDGSGAPYRAEKTDGSVGNYLAAEQVEPATKAEFDAQKTATTRLKVGDYAKVIGPNDNQNNYTLGEIILLKTYENNGIRNIYTGEKMNGSIGNYIRDYQLVLATAEEVRQAKYAVKIGDFKNGDWAEIVNPTGINADGDVRRAKGKTVKVTLYGPTGHRGLTLTDESGRRIGYANADALRKVDEPAQVSAFKSGDRVRSKLHGYERTLVKRNPELDSFGYGRAWETDGGGWLGEDQFELVTPVRVPVGSYVRISAAGEGLDVGAIAKVTEDDGTSTWPYRCELLDGSNYNWFDAKHFVVITEAEAKAAVDPRNQFAAGDKVRLISGGDEHPLYGFENGQVYDVSDPLATAHSDNRVRITRPGGAGYALPEQLVKLTEAEVEAERKAEAESAKWAAIGRKVGEYKAGDVVRIKRGQGGDPAGTVTEITSASGGSLGVKSVVRTNCTTWSASSIASELVTPVEQRFDAVA